ncbi:sodium:proton exchanger [Spirosoma utsteinense]|uniref:NhaP-type Na+/H+ and K+/H+ antiporter n=1 Tax=Spirosoma utsteinense TaxID=2585773 RepID=A0ABR6W093_9BACT|nr:sodium:proton exchanger [Spirosoma utsteinense]MBC3788140.1 NhaP-type Na+/H+ and K+/H+ antiporter [Spirosoma utsteinense]MBC3789998.1 NhaP-type Na+/H+ and K+/H+ antiporter [Spirosoma utsteinense]
MDSSILIIVLSLSVLISYAFDLFSSRFNTPSVLLLLLLGMITRQATDYFSVQVPYVDTILPTLGTLGLILIVLENGLDLELHTEKLSLLRRTLLASLSSIVGATLLIAGTLYLLLNDSFYHCLIAALPFSIISSAVAIPGVANLSSMKREFVVYESAFAGIVGVMAFNFLLLSQYSIWSAVWIFTRDTLTMALVSLVCCFLLLYLIGRINHRIKFLPIISVLFLVYAIAELNHLSSLLLILIFGLFLNNTELFVRGRLSLVLKNDLFEKELDQLKNLTAEGGFVVRTFFFLILGYSTVPRALIDTDALIVSGLFIALIIAWRWLTLQVTFQGRSNPLLWIAPRGLITILLYLNIPQDMRLLGFRDGIPILVVVLSSLVMVGGVRRGGQEM